MAEKTEGLKGVVVARSELCSIDAERGVLAYRGYDIADLAEHSSYEEVCYLLLHGELPRGDELSGFRDELGEAMVVSPAAQEIVDLAAASGASPMEMLRTAVSALAFDDPDTDSNELEATRRKAARLVAQLPTLIARYERRRGRADPVPPDGSLRYAENFLTMLRGAAPTEAEARAFDVAMILHAEHEMNASTFTARVVAATLSDLHSAVVAAIAALKGPLHGGANEWVMATLERIADEEEVFGEVEELFERKEKLPGFGHPVYRTMDPRARILKSLSEEFSSEDGADPRWFRMTERAEEAAMELKGLWPNVDLYSASLYRYLGIPTDLFTTLFAASRVVGWSAHVIEQYADNKIIRPASEYVGPPRREFPALSQRP